MSVVFLGAAAAFLLVCLLLSRAAESRRQRRSLVAFRLRFPRGLEVAAVQSFLGGLTGLLLPAWKRWLITPYVSLEVHASPVGITHYLLVPEAWSTAVTGLLQASVPSVRYEPVDLPFQVLAIGAEYRLNSHQRPLRVDPAGMNGKLLASLQPLGKDEAIVIEWLVTPHGPVQAPRLAKKQQQQLQIFSGDLNIFSGNLNSRQDADDLSALKQKQSHPLMLAAPRIGVTAADVRRARQLLRTTETVCVLIENERARRPKTGALSVRSYWSARGLSTGPATSSATGMTTLPAMGWSDLGLARRARDLASASR